MKFLIYILFIFTYIFTNAQKSNLKLYLSPLNSYKYTTSDILCDCSQKTTASFSVGLSYSYFLTDKKFQLETGLQYTHINIDFISLIETNGTLNNKTTSEKLNILTLPVLGNYYISNIFYIQSGLTFDIQTNNIEYYYPDQSGVGFHVGLGVKIPLNKFFIHINPIYKKFGVISFSNQYKYLKLSHFQLQIGLDYQL